MSHVTAEGILAQLGYVPKVWGYTQPAKTKRRKEGRGAGKGNGAPDEARKRELQSESFHMRLLKERWTKEREDAEEAHRSFRRWLDILHEERRCHMPKPGIVDWDVRHTVKKLRLVELPVPVRFMCLNAFGKYVRKVQKRHGWSDMDDPWPKGFGRGKDVYTSDWDRVKKALEIR